MMSVRTFLGLFADLELVLTLGEAWTFLLGVASPLVDGKIDISKQASNKLAWVMVNSKLLT